MAKEKLTTQKSSSLLEELMNKKKSQLGSDKATMPKIPKTLTAQMNKAQRQKKEK